MIPTNEIIDVVQVKFSWFDRAVLVLISAIAAAVFAYISSSIQRKKESKIEIIHSVSKEFLHQLDVIDLLIKDYWSVSGKDMESNEEIKFSSSIFVAFPHLQGIINLLFRLKKNKNADEKKEFERHIDKIYEYATSNISVVSREASADTIMKVGKEILNLKLKFQEFIYQ